jgi:hypothetical protein
MNLDTSEIFENFVCPCLQWQHQDKDHADFHYPLCNGHIKITKVDINFNCSNLLDNVFCMLKTTIFKVFFNLKTSISRFLCHTAIESALQYGNGPYNPDCYPTV